MNHKLSDRQQQPVVQIARSTDEVAKQALRTWIEEILRIRHSELSAWKKIELAARASARSDVIVPILRTMTRELKRIACDERTAPFLSFIFGSGLGLMLLGGKSAGLAAFGGAIGIPLWVVFGAGAAFVTVRYKKFSGGRAPRTDYRIIDAERDDR